MTVFKVLTVDDEQALRAGELRIMKNYQVPLAAFDDTVVFEVSEAGTGEDALVHLEHNKTDIVLLDLGLPGIQGMDVLQNINTKGMDTLVIIITAYASIETAVSTTKQGAFDFLAKPFSPEELRKTLSKATEHLFMQRHAKKLEQERHQQRFQLISVVSHELKSPINAVETYLKILADGKIEKTPEMLARIVDRSLVRIEAMRKLIVDLLDLTRIESGQKSRDIKVIDLCEHARRSSENIQHDAQARGIKVTLDIPARQELYGDPGEIDIIFNNLMSNAVKYNRDNGTISLRITPASDGCSVSVSDTGIGMTNEEAGKLFAEFVRIKNPKTAAIPGTGLGLSIVKRLVKLYQGDISVKSEPDVGTEFHFFLKNIVPEQKAVSETDTQA